MGPLAAYRTGVSLTLAIILSSIISAAILNPPTWVHITYTAALFIAADIIFRKEALEDGEPET